MRAGDFAGAWEISDAVLREREGVPCHDWPRHLQYVWDGRPLARQRVLVRCYHGLGDTVMFMRFMPLLKAIAREVIVWAQPALIPLLRTADGIDRLLPLHDGTPECDYDVDIEVMELAHASRITSETLPSAVPYFSVEPAMLLISPKLRVGLIWAAGGWDARRNVPVALLTSLARTEGVEIHLLQRGAALADWRDPGAVHSGTDDVLATAALMRALDLVISVDSFPAHLAGALGVPVWTLLPEPADWRWGGDESVGLVTDDGEQSGGRAGGHDGDAAHERAPYPASTTPWYPTMRLFRQPRPGDWESVMAPLTAALAARARDRRDNR